MTKWFREAAGLGCFFSRRKGNELADLGRGFGRSFFGCFFLGRRFQSQPVKTALGLLWVSPPSEFPAIFQLCREGCFRAGPLLASDCPRFPAVEERGAPLPRVDVAYATFVDPFTEHIFAFQVAFSCVGYGLRRAHA